MWNPDLSDGIEAIIDKCVQPAAENRYQNCADLLYDLEHPEYITKGYKKKQKRRLLGFGVAAGLCLLFLISGLVSKGYAKRINNNNYEALISVMASTSYEDKIESYKRAIEIYPYDMRAYNCILDAYENEGKFGKEENDELLALYNANKEGFDKSSAALAELNYKIGMMYFNYYTENENASLSGRVQKAHPFFLANYENREVVKDFKYEKLSDCYYHICTFYKKYILSFATVEEASRENYQELFEIIEEALESVENAGAYDKLTLYNAAFMLMYDQRSNMASVNFEQDLILELLDKVCDNASVLSVQKTQSKVLQKEILDNYNDCYEAIKRAYINAGKRG